ncbi:acyl-CoA dehydrogenase family protein [Brevibacterium ravenspurgense]|uniref:acyl-CoA dehydrogenase family protein n=1 Tax=Brevibacterium ravenspurgense TaxID=479117 RepID=UPI000784BB26|nr:acyl-CoA dehydrogenase family protein [Brevibacterium ravenspurgense]
MTDREQRLVELEEKYLPDELLERFRERAAQYDRDNAFFFEDLEELEQRGYLTLFVPEELGGPGLGMNEVSRLQQRLATAAPATALGVNMHFVCTGMMRAMWNRGDKSLQFALEEARDGEVFAFGVSEPGNDWVLQGSNTKAVPQEDGSYRLSGVKIFTSMTPAWTRLIVHGKDETAADGPELVYGFLTRGTEGVKSSDDWDVLGMRATHSRATILEDAVLEADRVVRHIPDGPNPDLLTFGITANFQLLIASVYAGLARRALEVASEALRKRRSAKNGGAPYTEIGEFRVRVADAALEFAAVPAQLDSYTRDFDECVDYGPAWAQRFVSAKYMAQKAARANAEAALHCAGGAGFGNVAEASRLYRDAAAGIFHPPAPEVSRAVFANAWLDD